MTKSGNNCIVYFGQLYHGGRKESFLHGYTNNYMPLSTNLMRGILPAVKLMT